MAPNYILYKEVMRNTDESRYIVVLIEPFVKFTRGGKK